MLRRLSKKVSQIFKRKDADNDLTASEQDYQVDIQSRERPHGRRFSAPERGTDYSRADPYLFTVPEVPQAKRPLSDQSRNGKLLLNRLSTIDDEAL
jgi:hypothetical protein